MKILLTGSNGFLGKELYEELKSHTITTLSRNNSSHNIDLSCSIPYFEKSFDLVIHLAGKAHFVPKIDLEKHLFHQINVIGTKNLLEGLSNKTPKHFVFISSVSVYGLIVGENINENCSLLAEDPYGKSKIDAEFVVKKWCEEHNVTCTILRLPLIVGTNPPGNLGSMIQGIKKGYYFNIAGGSAKKSMVLASDVAKYLLKASEIGGIFNLTDGYHPSLYELSETIAHQLGKSEPKNMPYWLAYLVARIGDSFGDKVPLNSAKLYKITYHLTFDDSKAREAFGWDPTPVLEEFKVSDKN